MPSWDLSTPQTPIRLAAMRPECVPVRFVEAAEAPAVRVEQAGLPPTLGGDGAPSQLRSMDPVNAEGAPSPAPLLIPQSRARGNDAGRSWGWLADELRDRRTKDVKPPAKADGASWRTTPFPDDVGAGASGTSDRDAPTRFAPALDNPKEKSLQERSPWMTPLLSPDGNRATRDEKGSVPPREWGSQKPASPKQDDGNRRMRGIFDASRE
jgi:hypothetical protein